MVVTTLCKEAVPLVRYRTHDLASIVPGKCDCGLNFPRHSTILGRSDDMIIFRGVNIYPGQIMDVISHYEELGGEYQIQLTRDEESKDHMLLTVEREKGYTNGASTRALRPDSPMNFTRLSSPESTSLSQIPASCPEPSASPSAWWISADGPPGSSFSPFARAPRFPGSSFPAPHCRSGPRGKKEARPPRPRARTPEPGLYAR